ncbi:73cd40c6-3568-4e87-9233-1521ec5bb1ec [Thermothielavioides terrestris]|uniref:73cd40c6-3568-4e87-9233-1521ec5bb1ec n=1 Tax=Thermothielavioides terrestris TaxID=2587410 RepID=A0A446BVU8_9PEZI|nr:73cd40c6-3568-4e87-9233-1521ec5bb1ec [Thermothielavioides terrestris]
MFWLGLLSLPAAQAQFSTTMLRFGCAQITIDRIDPLVQPGMVPSAHVHQVVGGNAFNATIPVTDVSKLATCTSCTFDQDLSNYWTANLYFRARNGTFHRVPQMANQQIGNANGGQTVYYTAPGPNTVTAFKPGFRMFSGDVNRRQPSGLGQRKQSCFRCYTGPNFQGNTYSPCFDPKLDTEGFPTTPCPGGIRSSVLFPICWDGKNLDSPNHIDHVAHPVDGPATFAQVDGQCPSTHPVKIPQIHYEIVWDTSKFNNKEDWPEDGSQPFVLSTGDPTGYGQHGDYVFGWKDNALQHAMDNHCFGPTCNGLTTQGFDKANQCTVKKTVREDTEGWLTELPGGHMVM